MKNGYWVIRTYEAGAIGEKTKFWVEGDKPPRSARRLKTEARKALANEHSAVKHLARILNANYGKGDILLGLDYSDEGLEQLISSIEGYELMEEAERLEAVRQAADHQAKLCLRRVKYAAGKKEPDVEIKSVLVTSDMDGKTGECVRIHHHLVVSSAALKYFEEKWTLGGVEYEVFGRQKDYWRVAEYLLDQVRKIPDAKKYTPSRNLVHPQPKDRIAKNGSQLRPPKGAVILKLGEWQPGRPQYMRYILPEAADLGGTVYPRE